MTGFETLCDSALKGTALIAAAYAGTQILRNRSAALRHNVWLGALAGMLVLLPAEYVVRLGGWGALGPQAGVVRAAATRITVFGNGSGISWSAALPLVWASGAALTLCFYLLGAARVAAIARRARRDESGVRFSPEVEMPCTFGAFDPVILLPETFESWDANRRRLVLAHEQAHIERRDGVVQILSQAATCLYWFHPLVWLAVRRLRIEREQACDDLVLQTGEAASQYAQNLLELASGRPLPVALAAAERSTLAQRIASILDPARERGRASRKSLALVCVALAALIVPLSAMQQGGGEQKQEEGSHQKVRLGGNVMQAKLIHKVTPAYPADAKARHSQGEVQLDVVVDREGAVKSISVISSPDTVLSDAAQEAVSQWRYETTLLNGKPVEVETTVMVNFTLSQ